MAETHDCDGGRIVTLDLLDSDGNPATVSMPVVVVARPDGTLVDPDTTQMQVELEQIRELLEDIKELLMEAFGLDLKQALAKKGARQFTMTHKEN